VLTTTGKTGARIERLTIDGVPHIAKHLRAGGDWLMRASGDHGLRELALWERGVFARMPPAIDHAVVATARDGPHGVLLMRDVSSSLLPDRDEAITAEQHDVFVENLAVMHATWWGRPDDIGLLTLAHRYLLFLPSIRAFEATRTEDSPLPRLIGDGWTRFAARAPRSARGVATLLEDPTPLVRALDATPSTLVHGDVKSANVGFAAGGHTILLDWALAGPGPPCADLAWHLSLNAARLPVTKESAIAQYRRALEHQGIDTQPWWTRQLDLCLLGAVLQMGWEKGLGGDDELAWWDDRAADTIGRHLS
jgi:Phosphotransferase enzyme family